MERFYNEKGCTEKKVEQIKTKSEGERKREKKERKRKQNFLLPLCGKTEVFLPARLQRPTQRLVAVPLTAILSLESRWGCRWKVAAEESLHESLQLSLQSRCRIVAARVAAIVAGTSLHLLSLAGRCRMSLEYRCYCIQYQHTKIGRKNENQSIKKKNHDSSSGESSTARLRTKSTDVRRWRSAPVRAERYSRTS